MTMRRTIGIISLCLLMVTLFSTIGLPADAEPVPAVEVLERSGQGSVVIPEMAAGAWRTRTQLVWDKNSQQLVRRQFSFWDPLAMGGYDFVWQPNEVSPDHSGRLSGKGIIVWRSRGASSYDRTAAVAQYEGEMREGFAEGRGEYVHRSGVAYKGTWHQGLMEGEGRLSFDNGDQYTGGFLQGKPHGAGKYIDATGTIYEGSFSSGVRQGNGLVSRPDGLIYRAVWQRGNEVRGSRKVLSQAGAMDADIHKVQYDEADDLKIGILVDRRKLDPDDPVKRLPYTAESDDQTLRIFPADERLMNVWRGSDQIQLNQDEQIDYMSYGKSFLGSRYRYEPVSVIFELENNSRKSVKINGAFLDVADSRTDLDPAVQLVTTDDEINAYCDPNANDSMPNFFLQNYGWSAATNVSAKMSFGSSSGKASDPLEINVDDIDKQVAVDLVPELQRFGVDTNQLAKRQLVCSDDPNWNFDEQAVGACLDRIRAEGTFGSLAPYISIREFHVGTTITGDLTYSWRDGSGSTQKKVSPFSKWILLGTLKHGAECGEGGVPSDFVGNVLNFKLDKRAYRLPLRLEAKVSPGKTRRWRAFMNAPKSSHHQFRVILELADGRRIASRPIDFLYFKPSR